MNVKVYSDTTVKVTFDDGEITLHKEKGYKQVIEITKEVAADLKKRLP